MFISIKKLGKSSPAKVWSNLNVPRVVNLAKMKSMTSQILMNLKDMLNIQTKFSPRSAKLMLQ